MEYPGVWDPIFDPDTWELLQLTIKARRERFKDSISSGRKYLLTGLLICGVCGQKLTGTGRYNNRMGERHYVYHCRKKGPYFPEGGCGSISRGRDALDHFITEAVLYRPDTPELAKLLTEDATGGQLSTLLDQRQLHKARIDGLTDDYATGLLDRSQFARAKQTAQAELQRLDAEIAALTAHSRVKLDVGQTLREAWDSNPPSWRRSLLELVIKQITVKPTRKKTGWYAAGDKVYRFNPDAIEIEWLA